jgi:glyoxylase-like metal-dependent hydrolase (beta-lactamase superfamily II)
VFDLGNNIRVTPILGGQMRLDGGAMFGVVPRPLWERYNSPDDRNRVANACRCLLVQSADTTVIVDTGCGDRFDAKGRDIFAVDADVSLLANLRDAGVEPADITHVLLTHLHFDHSAGALQAGTGELLPTFPNATHIVQRGEFEDAHAGRSIMRSSYLPKDLDTLSKSVNWLWTEGDGDILPHMRVEVTGGHTKHHQSVFISGQNETLLFPGDVLPTRAHLRPYWVMAYDMFPYDTFTKKQELARRACDGRWIVAWDHDPEFAFSRIVKDEAGFRAIAVDAGSET